MSIAQIQKGVAEAIREDPYGDHIRSISLFGSFLRGDNTPESDIDLLFEMRKPMSLFQIGGMQYRLEQSLGKKVDLVEKDSVIPQLRDEIIPSAKKIYERE
jgi:predicted nucleotidyltransferase